MTISSLTTLGAVRNARKPTRADVGARPAQADDADKPARLTDILAKTIPVEVVAPYTAFIAIVSTSVKKPTAQDPHPEQYLNYRWIALIALIVFAAGLTYGLYRRKAGTGARFPVAEVASATVAAAAWGLALPDSPLVAQIHDAAQGALVVGLVAFLGIGINSILSTLLRDTPQKTI